MTYQAIVENTGERSFKAAVLGWPSCKVAGATREEALARLREALSQRLSEVEIVPLEIDLPKDASPRLKFAWMFRDNPLFDEVVKEMEADRRQLDAAQGAL